MSVERFADTIGKILHARNSVIADLRIKLADALRDRDLAIAHDTQPYPTAEAYERVCSALRERDERIEALEKALRELLPHMNDLSVTTENAETSFEKALVQVRAALEAK